MVALQLWMTILSRPWRKRCRNWKTLRWATSHAEKSAPTSHSGDSWPSPVTTPPASGGIPPNPRLTAPQMDCSLTEFEVGDIPIPEESVLVITLLVYIRFPHLGYIHHIDKNWEKVVDAICHSGRIFDWSSEERPLSTFDAALMTLPQEPRSTSGVDRGTV